MTLTLQTQNTLAESTRAAEHSAEQLSEALARVAINPEKAKRLHEILGDYCHQCRNLLNTLNISLYLAQRGGSGADPVVWSTIESRYQDVAQFVEGLQWVCRPVPLHCVELSLHLLIEGRIADWSELLGKSGRRLVVEAPSLNVVGRFDPTRLERAFDDLVSWRSFVGDPSTDLRIRWTADSNAFQVEWDEVPARKTYAKAVASERGDRSEPTSSYLQSLAIPLLHRVMSLHGGSLVGSLGNPLRIRLSWPLAAPPS